MLGVTSLSIWDNTEIGKLRREGKFIPAPELQMLEENQGASLRTYIADAVFKHSCQQSRTGYGKNPGRQE